MLDRYPKVETPWISHGQYASTHWVPEETAYGHVHRIYLIQYPEQQLIE